MKKIRLVLITFLLPLLCLAALLVWSRSSQRGISLFVTRHQNDLEQMARDRLDGLRTAERYHGVAVEGVFPGQNPIVQFSSGGFGLAPSAVYQGFYYSESGRPAAYQNADVELVPVSDNQWTWTDGTDNGGMTRKIDGQWFFYKAWF